MPDQPRTPAPRAVRAVVRAVARAAGIAAVRAAGIAVARAAGIAAALLALAAAGASARSYAVQPSDYRSYYSLLAPGDTMLFLPGRYRNQLTLRDVAGAEGREIVLRGADQASVVFAGDACCNTVSLTRCAYLKIMDITIDGGGFAGIDGVKAEGTAGNWAHHITLENLRIVGHGGDQQTCGISTKCPAWNWVLRKNVIDRAGTGMYLGNSNGMAPFVNGLIEHNLVTNTVGYNLQVKYQLDTVRAQYAGTAVDGRTIIRHNVFSKDSNASGGGDQRPCVLVGGFPLTGWGMNDVYEVYGNFFYQNPSEALFQGTGNIAMYANVFVNTVAPPGYRAVYITAQDGKAPRNIRVFHNTLWVDGGGGGFRVYGADPAYRQYCAANAVFSPSPVSGFSDTLDNVAGAFADAPSSLVSPQILPGALDLAPRAGMLLGAATPATPFLDCPDGDRDFNGAAYDWRRRGAYSADGPNAGWRLRLDTIPMFAATPSTDAGRVPEHPAISVFPNPATRRIVCAGLDADADAWLLDLHGRTAARLRVSSGGAIDLPPLPPGMYILRARTPRGSAAVRIALLR